jgi:hypothetical protein
MQQWKLFSLADFTAPATGGQNKADNCQFNKHFAFIINGHMEISWCILKKHCMVEVIVILQGP